MNSLLKTLSASDIAKSFITLYKDGASFDIPLLTFLQSYHPSSITVDTISGLTDSNAITVGGVLMGYGRITTTIPNIYSIDTNLTAHAGGGQNNALVLLKEVNIITTCATNDDSVALLPATVGMIQKVINLGATKLAVYPQVGTQIDNLTGPIYYEILAGASRSFVSTSTTTIISF